MYLNKVVDAAICTCLLHVTMVTAVYIERTLTTHKNRQISSSSSLSPLLVIDRHYPLQCHRECVTTTSCEAFSETNTQCSLYGATINDTDVEVGMGMNLYTMGKSV